MSLPPHVTAALLSQGGPSPSAAYAYLADDFTDDTEANPLLRGWSYYKAAAIADAEVNASALQLEIVQGGSAANGSLWYTADPANEFDGMLVYKAIGPASGTPVSFDARARLVALNTAQDDDPPVAGGEYRYVVLAAHDPDRTNFNYVHVGIGADPSGLEVEVKTTDSDGVTAQSVYPVVAAAGGGASGMQYDVRIVRRRTNPQVFDCYYRSGTARALTDDTGWTLHTTIDRTDDATPVRGVAVELPDDLHLGIGVYANPTTHDIHGRCIEVVVLPTAA